MRADRAVGEDREVERTHLLEVAPCSARDQPRGAELLVGRAHHLAKVRGHGRIVKVLEDDDGRPGKLFE